ncbi:DUF3168 domain-containing protein [Methanolobus mangrovi]|uniref:DUF3168 domain-containing protein n=1 Tax=Methanolobus mangrovi TaxID=3072977 RepID=A0AA51YH28_9EURY|nr:DUF3168 domain-containing protein [Methanolobus mangrovi]WMW22741.1 DUF3168 domain-containing protein [Methanolobus mangrovi]
MTSVHGALRNLLLQDTSVTDLVSDRIYPLRLPLDCQMPAISIHKISNPIDHVTGFATPRYQFSCWSETYAQVQQLSNAVIDCLNRYKGVADGNLIKQIAYLDSHDAIEDGSGIFHIPIDFKIIHMR